MTRRRHAPEQILQRLRDMEVLQAEGQSMAEIAKRFEVSEQTLHRRRNQFDGMKGEEMKRLKELELSPCHDILKGQDDVRDRGLGARAALRSAESSVCLLEQAPRPGFAAALSRASGTALRGGVRGARVARTTFSSPLRSRSSGR